MSYSYQTTSKASNNRKRLPDEHDNDPEKIFPQCAPRSVTAETSLLLDSTVEIEIPKGRPTKKARRKKYNRDEVCALNALANKLLATKKNNSASTICSFGEYIPLSFDQDRAPKKVAPNTEKGKALAEFYSTQHKWSCRIAGCDSEATGITEIMGHVRDHHSEKRPFKFFCVEKNCMEPFEKLGDANRHFKNVHKGRNRAEAYQGEQEDNPSIRDDRPRAQTSQEKKEICIARKTPLSSSPSMPFATAPGKGEKCTPAHRDESSAKPSDAPEANKSSRPVEDECIRALVQHNKNHPAADSLSDEKEHFAACLLQYWRHYHSRFHD